jgi:type I restriction enzyme S subunit
LGTNINNLNSSLVNGFKIIIPPKELIKEFNKIAFPLYEKIGNNFKENQQLSSIRDWLLPLLMNGQVKVGDVEEVGGLMAAEPVVRYGKK